MAMFTIWTIPCAVAQNIQTMVIARFFCGFSGTALLGVAGGTVHDLFEPEKLGLPMSITAVAPFAGPSLGPLIGGFM
jgi:MFS family permease